ncbi:uncharacterized protein LOC142539221 isoform X2 [Primulina tabacum]|uniref:uncharacterized protein LOC142539221 isoform X2 n=1 Tax=Primulina tabacum TaxID=48773 RepID=UPI003F59D315
MPQPEYPNHTRPEPVLGFETADGSDFPEAQHHQRGGGFESMPVIDAVPISMVAPEDVLPEPTPKVAKRRSMEEMAKRPEWLPEDWRIDLRVRTSGASTGLIDRLSGSKKSKNSSSIPLGGLNNVQANSPRRT